VIVHRISKTLFASQVTLCGLHRNVAKQELDLLQFASSFVAQFRAGSPKIMRRYSREPLFDAACLTMDQITFGVKPVPHTRPALLIDRNNVPDMMEAGIAQ
jgi:hypothetical protein